MRGPIQLFQDSWNIYRNNWKLLLGIFIIPGLVTAVFDYLTATDAQTEMFMTTYPLGFFGLLAAMIILLLLMTLGMYKAVAEPDATTIERAYRFAAQHFIQYLILSIMVGVVVMLGFIALIIPGIIFAVWFSFSYLVLIFEGKRGIDAMKASKEYVRGHWWGVFGRFAALAVGVILVSIVAGIVGHLILNMLVAPSLVQALISFAIGAVTMPVASAYTYFIYQDLKGLNNTAVIDATTAALGETDDTNV